MKNAFNTQQYFRSQLLLLTRYYSMRTFEIVTVQYVFSNETFLENTSNRKMALFRVELQLTTLVGHRS